MLTTPRTRRPLAALMRNNRKYLIGLHTLALLLFTVAAFGQTAINPIDKARFFAWQQYQDHLSRSPDQGGLNAWADYIDQCAPSDVACIQQRRITTARGFLESWEFRNTILCQQRGTCDLWNYPPNTDAYNREYIRQVYLTYLRREPDQGGYNAWLNYINSHPNEYDTIVNGFIQSYEYRQRFVISPENIEEVYAYWQWDAAAQVWFTYPPLESSNSKIVDTWCEDTMCYYEEEYDFSFSQPAFNEEGHVRPYMQARRRKKLPPGARGFEQFVGRDASDKLIRGTATR